MKFAVIVALLAAPSPNALNVREGVSGPADFKDVETVLEHVLSLHMTPEMHKRAQVVAADIKTSIGAIASNLSMTKAERRAKVAAAIGEIGQFQGELEKQTSHVGKLVSESDQHAKKCPANAWDKTGVIGKDGTNRCSWVSMNNAAMSQFCARSYTDVVSSEVKRTGGWSDCAALQSWWFFLPDRSVDHGAFVPCGVAGQTPASKLYVDVGSNMGACLIPMAALDAVPMAVAFEPNPANLFYLSNSLMKNVRPKKHSVLYPYALGDAARTENIYMEPGNAGNTVVGKPTNANSTPTGHVHITTLDTIFTNSGSPPYIHLMKLDAQGYEVKILAGAKRLFASGAVNAIKFEMAPEWLEAQGSTAQEYVNSFLSLGFEIYNSDTKSKLLALQVYNLACSPPYVADFVAVHLGDGETATQSQVTC